MHDSPISRRSVFKLLVAASAAGTLPKAAMAQAPPRRSREFGNPLNDPKFQEPYVITWEKPLTEAELATLTVLVDLILPADDTSPAASAIELPDFLNEWVGAPYQQNADDYEILRGGLAWLNTHSHRRHGKSFTDLAEGQQTAILDQICDPAKAAPEFTYGARFFSRLRNLAVNGYYTHSSTWRSLGYVGNVPIAGDYPGVPEEILRMLGLEDVS